jgi:hypothetical protein
MHIVKIGLAFAVVGTLIIGASVQLSFAQGGGLKINQLRAEAIHTCSTAAAKYPDYVWGNMEMFIASRSDPKVLWQQQGRRELMASFEEGQRLCRLRSIAQLGVAHPGKDSKSLRSMAPLSKQPQA